VTLTFIRYIRNLPIFPITLIRETGKAEGQRSGDAGDTVYGDTTVSYKDDSIKLTVFENTKHFFGYKRLQGAT